MGLKWLWVTLFPFPWLEIHKSKLWNEVNVAQNELLNAVAILEWLCVKEEIRKAFALMYERLFSSTNYCMGALPPHICAELLGASGRSVPGELAMTFC